MKLTLYLLGETKTSNSSTEMSMGGGVPTRLVESGSAAESNA